MSDGESGRDAVERFSDRVSAYARHRPAYPDAALDLLEERHMLRVGSRVADIGAGTGLLTEQLLERGCEVWAVEPNDAMRSVAEASLIDRQAYHSIVGTAEDTSLEEDSVDLVTVAQAFHWFDRKAVSREFRRITKRPHRVALLWNIRDDSDPLVQDLQELIDEFAVDFDEADYTEATTRAALNELYGRGDAWARDEFEHAQHLGRADLAGLVTSWSYMPAPGSDSFDSMQEALGEIFTEHEEGGEVELPYLCKLFYGQIMEE